MNAQPKITPTFADQAAVLNPYPFRDLGRWAQPIVDVTEEPPKAEEKPLKIALIGTAPSSRHLAPYGDPSWTIWSCSPGNMNQLPRFDAWFEIHSIDGNLLTAEHKSYGEPYLKWMQDGTFPVYMQDNVHVPRATVVPKDDLVAEFGEYFFTSSFAWMAALAIKFGAKEIGFYGIDMASKDEYILQRAGGHYFIQTARQRGIKVIVPPESDLAQPSPLYGYSENTAFGRKLVARKAEINARLSQMNAQQSELVRNITYLQGAAEDLDYISTIWSGIG